MNKLIVSLVAATFFLSGCDVNPSEFGKEEAKKFAQVITYTKDDRTGLCFAIVASRKTGDTNQSGMGMSEVPCEKVAHMMK